MRTIEKFCVVSAVLSIGGIATPTHGADTFTGRGVASGSTMSETECRDAQRDFPDTAVYVTVDGRGECIRYFHSGLGTTTRKAVVYMAGDQIYARTSVYPNSLLTPAQLQRGADQNAVPPHVAYIELARPGVRGSSGDHKQRRRAREGKIVDAALTAIKNKHDIDRLTLVGQSGGGHLVAVLLAKRDDIDCAVPTSAVTMVVARYRDKGNTVDATGYVDSVDPIDQVKSIPLAKERRVFVVASPTDTNVPYRFQVEYLKAVAAKGHDATLITATGGGSEGHSLSDVGIAVALACAAGLPSAQIAAIAERSPQDRSQIARALTAETKRALASAGLK